MRLKIGLAALLLLLLACAACSPRGLLVPVATETPTEPAAEPMVMMGSLATPELPLETPSPTLPASATPTLTARPPTPVSGTPPAPEAWSGAPTYFDSLPGYFFRLEYDPRLWTPAEDLQGEPSLLHNGIEQCRITRAVGRGLPPGWNVDDNSFRLIGTIDYEVVRVSHNGILQYVNYFGSDGTVFTGFQVTFESLAEDCLRDAETVLATLSSILAPTPSPTVTP
ncbi:MAG: hypothetical protein FD146_206 [Anaerolineaceae bacterium]|nr:MAG: hypothetical protein FD146_206 [Anaerolineaceae bacterium]